VLVSLTSRLARHQSLTDFTHWISWQGHAEILQRTVEPLFECSIQSSRRPQRTARSEEAGTHTRKGRPYIFLQGHCWHP